MLIDKNVAKAEIPPELDGTAIANVARKVGMALHATHTEQASAGASRAASTSISTDTEDTSADITMTGNAFPRSAEPEDESVASHGDEVHALVDSQQVGLAVAEHLSQDDLHAGNDQPDEDAMLDNAEAPSATIPKTLRPTSCSNGNTPTSTVPRIMTSAVVQQPKAERSGSNGARDNRGKVPPTPSPTSAGAEQIANSVACRCIPIAHLPSTATTSLLVTSLSEQTSRWTDLTRTSFQALCNWKLATRYSCSSPRSMSRCRRHYSKRL